MSAEKMRKQALKLFSEQPLTLKELAGKMEIKDKKAFNILKSLFEKGDVEQFKDGNSERRYRIACAVA